MTIGTTAGTIIGAVALRAISGDLEMFHKNGMSANEVIAKIKGYKAIEDRLAYQENFDMEVQRINPPYSPEKALILSQLITNVSYTTESLEYEDGVHGSAYTSHFNGVTASEISITWYDLKRNDIVDFLTLISPRNKETLEDLPFGANTIRAVNSIKDLINKSNSNKAILVEGEDDTRPILPQDGTYLLPRDYYFTIRHTTMEIDSVTGMRLPTLLSQGEYVLNGGLSIERDLEGEGFAKITANFKPL